VPASNSFIMSNASETGSIFPGSFLQSPGTHLPIASTELNINTATMLPKTTAIDATLNAQRSNRVRGQKEGSVRTINYKNCRGISD